MATTGETLKIKKSTSRRIILMATAVLGILTLSGLFLTLNYWWAVIFLFVSLLILFGFSFDEYEARGLLLLVTFSLFVAVLVTSLALLFLSNSPELRQLAQDNATANIFFGSDSAIVFTSIFTGILAAIGVVIFFLLLVAIAAAGILRWHRTDPRVSFSQIFWHLLTTLCGIFHFSVVVDSFEVKGSTRDKARLENYGGPGWLTVYPGHMVVLHKWGQITRIVGLGSTILRHEEQIRVILPVRPKGDFNEIINVLTRDKISLVKMKVLFASQIEPAAETKIRFQKTIDDAKTHLQDKKTQNAPEDEIKTAEQTLKDAEIQLKSLDNDRLVGDDYNQCYESIVKMVAIKDPDIWRALKSPVERNLRDIIMSEDFEKLFGTNKDNSDLAARINQRKIEEIEKIVFEKAKQAKIVDGIVLRLLDIQEVQFPQKIETKLNEEIETLIDERIEQTRIRLAESKAKSDVIAAKARAQAKILEGQGDGESHAAEFREILRELKREESLPREQMANAVLQLISAKTSMKELENFLKTAAIMNPRLIISEDSGKPNGSGPK